MTMAAARARGSRALAAANVILRYRARPDGSIVF